MNPCELFNAKFIHIKQNYTNKQKQCNFQEPTNTIDKFSCVESIDIEPDNSKTQ